MIDDCTLKWLCCFVSRTRAALIRQLTRCNVSPKQSLAVDISASAVLSHVSVRLLYSVDDSLFDQVTHSLLHLFNF